MNRREFAASAMAAGLFNAIGPSLGKAAPLEFPFPEPRLIETEVFAELPAEHRRPGQKSYWADRNRRGASVDSFIEGPSFDRDGNLFFVDIPYGRIFRADPAGVVDLVAEYDGQPNGLKVHKDGRIFVSDFQNGIMIVDPATGAVSPILRDANTEAFKGVNDLYFKSDGTLYFTDQGQTGLQDPTGRVYAWEEASGRLESLVETVPSPNGLVLDLNEHVLFVSATRANAVWRLPLAQSGGVGKAGNFLQFTGGRAGPDGLALTADGGVVVCQTGLGLVWIHNTMGLPIAVVRSSRGLGTTNCAFGGPGNRSLFITESDTGSILRADVGIAGHPMFSGWGGQPQQQ